MDDLRDAYVLICKRILKSVLSTNPETLQGYKHNIITAHNQFVEYVLSRFDNVSETKKATYTKNLLYIRDKTNNCFQKLKINYPFTNDIFELIDETQVIYIDPIDNNDNDNNSDNQDEMALTLVEFLNFATKIIPEFDGIYANLQSFNDAVNLANASVGTHTPSFIELIKTKLKNNARNCVSNEATVQAIIDALRLHIKPESSSLIESKMMNIHQAKKKASDYMKEIESLTADLKRAHITEGIPITAADNLSTKTAIKAIRQNASSNKVKWLMEAGNFRDLNEVVDKFVSLSTADSTETSNQATINYINKRQNVNNYRGRRPNNRGYYRRNNYQPNSYNSNYRSNNHRGSNNRGYYRNNDNRRGNNSFNSNRRTNQVRYLDAGDETASGNSLGPQQLMLRDA